MVKIEPLKWGTCASEKSRQNPGVPIKGQKRPIHFARCENRDDLSFVARTNG